MMFLHQHQIIHRDLKPGNILIDGEYHPHITDFGLSKFNDSNYSISQSQQCGTSMYMAPEIIEGNKYNGKVDVYSFGILMYEVISNSIPYPLFVAGKISAFSFNKKVVDDNYRPKFNFKINKSIKKLIESCWDKDPKKRPTFEQIYQKLAFNIDNLAGDVYDDVEKTENEDEDEIDLEPENYYLDDVDVNEVISYANDIDDSVHNSKDTKESESKDELIEKIINPLKKEIEELKIQISNIQKERETEKMSFLNEIQILKEKLENEKKEQNLKIESIKEQSEKDVISLIDKVKQNFDEKLKNIQENMNSKIEQISKEKDKNSQNNATDPIQLISKITSVVNLKENDNYEAFNNLNGESQTIILLEYLNKNKGTVFVQTIGNLLSFLLKEQSKANKRFDQIKYIYIQTSNQRQKLFYSKDDIEKTIISNGSIEMLIDNNSIESTEFIDIINSLNNVHVELNYPSNEYQKIYNSLVKIKRSKKFNLIIDVKISAIKSNDKSFQHSKYIDLIQILNSVSSINGEYQNGFFEDCSLSKIVFSEKNTSIGCYSFSRCKNLKEIIFSSSVKNIGANVFEYCSSLTKLIIPPTVGYIGEYAFSNCNNLSEITIDPYNTQIQSNTFNECSSLNHLLFSSNITSIKEFDFDRYWKLTKITIPQSVFGINSGSFSNCSSLKYIIIPSSVKLIGNNTFQNCTSLSRISIPSSVLSIGENSFKNCTSLEEVILESNLTEICDNCFYGCPKINKSDYEKYQAKKYMKILEDCCESKPIPLNVVKNLFKTNVLNSPGFIHAIKIYGSNVYFEINYSNTLLLSDLMELKKNVGPKVIITINVTGTNKFDNRYKENNMINKVLLCKGIKLIDNYAFSQCSSLSKISIPSSVKCIGKYSFARCSSLVEVFIPVGVTQIGECAFRNCSSLKKVFLPHTLVTIGNCAFSYCTELLQIEIPSSVTIIEYGTFEGCSSLVNVSIPFSVTSIGNHAFRYCDNLKNINVPNSVISIGNDVWPSNIKIAHIEPDKQK